MSPDYPVLPIYHKHDDRRRAVAGFLAHGIAGALAWDHKYLSMFVAEVRRPDSGWRECRAGDDAGAVFAMALDTDNPEPKADGPD
jgi:hypothetical protein